MQSVESLSLFCWADLSYHLKKPIIKKTFMFFPQVSIAKHLKNPMVHDSELDIQ